MKCWLISRRGGIVRTVEIHDKESISSMMLGLCTFVSSAKFLCVSTALGELVGGPLFAALAAAKTLRAKTAA